jgi:hypothetical protein
LNVWLSTFHRLRSSAIEAGRMTLRGRFIIIFALTSIFHRAWLGAQQFVEERRKVGLDHGAERPAACEDERSRALVCKSARRLTQLPFMISSG